MNIKVNSNYNYSYQFIKAYFEELFAKVETLQPTLTAGDNISINDGVISATDTKYTAGDGIDISAENEISTEEDLTPLHYMTYNTPDEEIQTSKPIIQPVSGYSIDSINTEHGVSLNFAGVSRNGDKLSIVLAGEIIADAEPAFYLNNMAVLNIPANVYAKLVPDILGYIDYKATIFVKTNGTSSLGVAIEKVNNTNKLSYNIIGYSALTGGDTYTFRIETTFLLSDNLVPQA